jgi:hypothetical protein
VRGTAKLIVSIKDMQNVILGHTEIPETAFPPDTIIHDVERDGDDFVFFMSSDKFSTETTERYGLVSEKLLSPEIAC